MLILVVAQQCLERLDFRTQPPGNKIAARAKIRQQVSVQVQSRDVRAPNLAELFGGARVNNGSVTDDFNLNGGAPNQSISPLPNPIVANAALKPEKGQTTELGLVWSPSYIPGLNISATYWRVGVKGRPCVRPGRRPWPVLRARRGGGR